MIVRPRAYDRADALRENVGRVFIGEPGVTTHLLAGLFAAGHVLIEDVPGVGKTTLARALATSIDCTFRRIQFTPDLLPSDVLGVSLYDPKAAEFVFKPGPIFANVILADEINRTPPRTQSALLECMNEGQVSLDGATHVLPQPFMVLATMNPAESHGTYELPESQLDRFLLRLSLGYPSREQEKEIFRQQRTSQPLDELKAVVAGGEVLALQKLVRETRVAPELEDYAVAIVQGTRQHPEVALGCSPRATLALFRGAQALAFLRRRDYVVPDDVKEMAGPVLAHRIVTRSAGETREGQTRIVDEILGRTPVP